MIKKLCDRCKREENRENEYSFDYFIKVLNFDFCPKCHFKLMQMINEFVNNTNQTTGVNEK